MAKTIKIKRSGDVFQSEREAIAFLARTPHQPGQLILVRYWASETETDAILAIGIQTGSGPGTYTIISTGGIKVIPGIIRSEQELPDSSQLINGETWLYQEPVTFDLYWIYLYENAREVVPVNPDINYRVFCLSDNTEYLIYGGTVEKANGPHGGGPSQETEELLENLSRRIDEVSDSVTSGLQSISGVLGISSGYPGTVQGATSFDSADDILQSRITQASQSIQALSNRVSDLEREFTSNSEGLSTTTRLDTIYAWYDQLTHVTSGTIEFSRTPNTLVQESLVTVKAIYRWSWASRGLWVGLRLGNEIRQFGDNDVPSADVPDGYYEWDVQVTIGSSPVTFEAAFEGSGLDPVRYTINPEPIKRGITISWPTQGWNAPEYTYKVKFKGSGLPASAASNILSVTQGDTEVYRSLEGQSTSKNTTYTGTLTGDTLVRATWDTVQSEENFKATYLVVLPKGSTVTTESLEASDQVWMSYQESPLFETPYITYESDQTLTILSPDGFSIQGISCIPSGQSDPLTVTSDFTSPGTIQYHGITYDYISFPKIGAGTFKFIIT